MKSYQRIIKYGAIAFAVLLIVSIFGGIISAFSSISIFTGSSKDAPGNMREYDVRQDMENLEIELTGSKLEIRTGEKFALSANHKYLSVKDTGGVLVLKETKKVWGLSSKTPTIILTLPEDMVFGKIDIQSGAGTIKAEALTTEDLRIELGAGEMEIESLTASNSSKLECGAGEMNIDSGELANLTLNLGAGDIELRSRLTGNSNLDYGVGELDLTLCGREEDYSITVDRGIGEARINGEKVTEDEIYGHGPNSIAVDGGVGELKVEYDNINWK